MTAVYVMHYFFYAELLLPSVIRSYLLKWRPNDKAQPSAKMFLKNSCGVVFIYVKQWLYIWRHVIVLLQAELSWSSRESSEMCPPDSLFPSYRSHAYKPPLRILTQITLPTPARMKTNVGEGTTARFLVCLHTGLFLRKLFLPHGFNVACSLLLPARRRNSYTDRCDVKARISKALLGCRVTSSCGACRWPEVTPGRPSSLQDPCECTLPPWILLLTPRVVLREILWNRARSSTLRREGKALCLILSWLHMLLVSPAQGCFLFCFYFWKTKKA